ncbi:L-aspartate oxidase [Bradyrhizobium lablabi]|uniref:L-aspartate oxidase n=1 Tax=Bradyrhizobium lablabi TaxID=722472 RepID=UPI001BA754A6|nr:L-aspartate oxidase [Bradyrhizobium lablabi]MBR1120006.1 L-aspartate oxidase [Bradyrhizobium lablabi]
MTTLHDIDGAPVIIGGGLAGLMTALALAPQPVVLLTRAPLGLEASSVLAQGGIAAAIGADDNASLHLADTLAAGAGLCDETVAAAITAAAPDAINQLVRLGVAFDRDASGEIVLGLEAAHSRRRIVHAGGDATGRDIIGALARCVYETPSITVIEGATARRLVVEDNAVRGVLADTEHGPVLFATGRVVIATGGIGGLFLHSTNPAGSFGQGLALAARAGAVMGDLEFVQFHPTALDDNAYPSKLVSEAVRGEGAILIDEEGERFMADVPGAELAPRDVVARAIWQHAAGGHRVFLDARNVKGLDFARRFPAITALCRQSGIDPVTQPMPVRPAAHYHMGGILVDLSGRSSVDGLWACGEAACTGLHGANRLASNSLLEAAVCAGWVARDIAATTATARRMPPVPNAGAGSDAAAVRAILSRAAGVLRNADGLRTAAGSLLPLALSRQAASDPALVGLMIVIAALRREESRGAHARTDFPGQHDLARRSTLRIHEALEAAQDCVPELAI